MRHIVFVVACLPLISACQVVRGVDAGVASVRILCGFADIVMAETDIPKVEAAFAGEESFGKKICRAFRAYSQEQQPGAVPVDGGTVTVLPLPSGETIDLKILPSTVNHPETQ